MSSIIILVIVPRLLTFALTLSWLRLFKSFGRIKLTINRVCISCNENRHEISMAYSSCRVMAKILSSLKIHTLYVLYIYTISHNEDLNVVNNLGKILQSSDKSPHSETQTNPYPVSNRLLHISVILNRLREWIH